MKKISALGLDIGSKRVGVAGCDGIGLIATGLTTIVRTSFASDVEQFKKLVAQREAAILVVGLPYSMNGMIETQAKQVQKYAQRLAKALELPLEYIDERLTSVEAEEQLKSQKRFSTKDKGAIDKQAATIILQQWLDQRRAFLSSSIYNESL
ncbi:Holliday junction resolvase RuvX [Aphanothece hegewaldii CCALA 016]|uniref:Putative pre-16S rRNA nuclease n=1 Tax=Aphanothece hegewaldii CCALA 016 TaxID=2107694 RepID=A0A2T1M2Y1_9CHRO|nr:Holliday junction resolvase RuvX [Aphanothece hegewaldii]PSF39102.1 Holliday junction resolvase RuvX [Aphanothece hegewaldii CCALA 016]